MHCESHLCEGEVRNEAGADGTSLALSHGNAQAFGHPHVGLQLMLPWNFFLLLLPILCADAVCSAPLLWLVAAGTAETSADRSAFCRLKAHLEQGRNK